MNRKSPNRPGKPVGNPACGIIRGLQDKGNSMLLAGQGADFDENGIKK